MNDDLKDWKLRLRYGQLKTTFSHFTVLADGMAGTLIYGLECLPGRAWMSMKVWAIDDAQAMDMIAVIGQQIGFTVDGRIEVYVTEPEEPPSDKPRGYAISFTSYKEGDA
jgi:hypothetical protein